MIDDYGFRTDDDFNGRISTIIKKVREYNKKGKSVKDLINYLRNPNEKNDDFNNRSDTEIRIRQQNNGQDYGIGEKE